MLNKRRISGIYRRLKKPIHDAYDLNCQVLLKNHILIGHVKSIQLDVSMYSIRKVPSRASLSKSVPCIVTFIIRITICVNC